jgi:hypothetical protein
MHDASWSNRKRKWSRSTAVRFSFSSCTRFVSEASCVLAPWGVLVCSYWNRRSIRGAVFRALSLVESARKRGRARTFDAYYRGAPYSTFRSKLRARGFRIEREEGICWFPFRRSSDSGLIPAAVATERLLGLRRLPRVSPWVLCVATLDPDPDS